LKLSIISDELSEDFQTAVEIGYSWGIRNFEIRNAWLSRVPGISNPGIEIIKRTIKEYSLNITTLSPGLFKIPLSSEELGYHRKELIQKTFRLAEELGVSCITIFGLKRSPTDGANDYQRVIRVIGETASLAEREGFTLLLENEAGWWADTGENTAKIVNDIGSSALKLTWDPGNAFSAGEEPYPKGYNTVKDKIANIHIKMAVRNLDGKTCYLSEIGGYLDLREQISALKQDNYQGYICIETHQEPKIEQSRKCLQILTKWV